MPAATPVTTPVLPIVATVTLLLIHAPPAVPSESAMVVVAQTLEGPDIGPGSGSTLTTIVDEQPDDKV